MVAKVGTRSWLWPLVCVRAVVGEAAVELTVPAPARTASAFSLPTLPEATEQRGGVAAPPQAVPSSGSSSSTGSSIDETNSRSAFADPAAGTPPTDSFERPVVSSAASPSFRGNAGNSTGSSYVLAESGGGAKSDGGWGELEMVVVLVLVMYGVLLAVAMYKTKKGTHERQLADRFLCCWGDLYTGHAFWLYNVIFSPVLLVLHAIRIYLGGCLYVYCVERLFFLTCWWATSYFEDEEFGPGPKSLGNVGGDTANASSGKSDSEVVWVRASEFSRKDMGERPAHPRLHDTDMELFHGKIEPNDIQQGGLGNCWLMAALAALSEHEGAVESVFLTKEVDPRGKYRVRLFDPQEKEWKVIVVDEFVPCMTSSYAKDKIWREESGMPKTMFATPHGREIWVMMIEKAFAKLCGSYAALEGGFTEWGVMCMTGNPAWRYELDGGKFVRSDIVPMKDPKSPHDKRAVGFRTKAEESYEIDEFFKVVRYHHQTGAVLCCGGVTKDNSASKLGLVSGHAFSLLQVESVRLSAMSTKTIRMVQIRNPWGTGEWTGDWSDKSPKWEEFPHVAATLKHTAGGHDDGAFWMEWGDFCTFWGYVGVVDCTTDISTLHMPGYNEKEREGPLKSFGMGCFRYWCMCIGPVRWFVNHRPSTDKVTDGNYESTCGIDIDGNFYCNLCSEHAQKKKKKLPDAPSSSS